MIKMTCNRCGNELDFDRSKENETLFLPRNGITISGHVVNGMEEDRAIIYDGTGEKHFCSKLCLIHYFFKPVIDHKSIPKLINSIPTDSKNDDGFKAVEELKGDSDKPQRYIREDLVHQMLYGLAKNCF